MQAEVFLQGDAVALRGGALGPIRRGETEKELARCCPEAFKDFAAIEQTRKRVESGECAHWEVEQLEAQMAATLVCEDRFQVLHVKLGNLGVVTFLSGDLPLLARAEITTERWGEILRMAPEWAWLLPGALRRARQLLRQAAAAARLPSSGPEMIF